MTVTALIPSYGRPQSLRRCLEGLARAESPPDEVIVVVRDTDAETREALRTHPTVRVVTVAAPGQIAALNAGLPHATGDIICFPDDDCVPRPDWLARLLPHYDDPQVGGVGGRDVVTTVPEPPSVSRVGVITWYGRIIGNHHCPLAGGARPVRHLKGVNMSFRRALVPPFDTRIRGPHCNDTDISLAVGGQGYRLIFDPEARVDHYPAARPDEPAGRNLSDPRLAYLDCHDRMFVLLKHLPGCQKPLAVAYHLLIGTRVQPGLLMALAVGWAHPLQTLRVLVAGLKGTCAGIRTVSSRS
jgi:GT2 family glycosyltransferase